MITRHQLEDDELRALLQRVDPSTGSPPLTAEQRGRIVHRTVSARLAPDDDTSADSSREVHRRRRTRLVGTVGGLAVAAASVGVVGGVVLGGVANTEQTALPRGDRPLELTLPRSSGPAADCAPVSAEIIGSSDTAFAGTVTGIADGTVTLRVTTVFAGDPGSAVEIPRSDGTSSELGLGRFEADGEYLISASDGVIRVCGQSGTDTPELAAIYREAFSR